MVGAAFNASMPPSAGPKLTGQSADFLLIDQATPKEGGMGRNIPTLPGAHTRRRERGLHTSCQRLKEGL